MGLHYKTFSRMQSVSSHQKPLPCGLIKMNLDLLGVYWNFSINSKTKPPSTPTSTVCSHCCVCICVYTDQGSTDIGRILIRWSIGQPLRQCSKSYNMAAFIAKLKLRADICDWNTRQHAQFSYLILSCHDCPSSGWNCSVRNWPIH